MNRVIIPSLIVFSITATASHGQSAPSAGAPAKIAASPVVVPARPAVVIARPSVRRRRHAASPAMTRVASANLATTRQPRAQGFVNAVQVYPYSEGAIYQLYAAPGTVTDIALQRGENLVAVASGDTVRWVIGDTTSGASAEKRTHVLVKPFASGLATNLVITTDRRSYHLQLTATPDTAMAALSWIYPADELLALRRTTEQAEALAAGGVAIDQLHFNYMIRGDRPSWRPLRAFDDGRQTFLEFPASIAVGEAPPLFLIGVTGEAELVNYRVSGRYYVVDRLFDAAELRLGTKKQQIVRIERVAGDGAARKGRRS